MFYEQDRINDDEVEVKLHRKYLYDREKRDALEADLELVRPYRFETRLFDDDDDENDMIVVGGRVLANGTVIY